MLEITKSYSSIPIDENRRIRIASNPSDALDLQFLFHTRIFIFEESGGSLNIDFTEQYIQPNSLYIVPPMHFHYLFPSGIGNFACIDIDNILLKDYQKKLLYAIRYNKQKCLPLLNDAGDDCNYKNIVRLSQTNYDEHRIISTIGRWIENRTPKKLLAKQKNQNSNYIEIADRFLGLLEQKKLTVETCKINSLATEMFCSERTLHRICTGVFGLCAKDVSNYHIALKALFLLTNPQLGFNDIAIELKFSSNTSFNHFIKKFTGLTPSQIREYLRNAGM